DVGRRGGSVGRWRNRCLASSAGAPAGPLAVAGQRGSAGDAARRRRPPRVMTDEELIQIVDELEAHADGYITLEQVEEALGHSTADAIAQSLLLVDYREFVDPSTGERTAVTPSLPNPQRPPGRHPTP